MNGDISSCMVTGASGFIGGHVCAMLAAGGAPAFRGLDLVPPAGSRGYPFSRADIRNPRLSRLMAGGRVDAVLHLAARAEVVIPFGELADLMDTNVSGTARVLAALRPRHMVFASSSAVYGNGGPRPVKANGKPHQAVGAYGVSKAAAEVVCREWAGQGDGSAVSLRLGNIVGAGCRGLIPYLVAHARRHPDGSVPARIRGGGRLVRDYVPVRHTAEVMIAALLASAAPGTAEALNVGTGLGRTNGEVARQVQRILEGRGFPLRVEADAPLVPGEAAEIVLEPGSTYDRFGVAAPTSSDVDRAIEEATLHFLAESPGGPAAEP